MGEQQENLDRVSARIGPFIVRFCRERLGQRFFAKDLHEYVLREAGIRIAPASADRILRDLRQRGVINYRVVSRRESLYEVISVRGMAVKSGHANGKISSSGSGNLPHDVAS